MNARPIRSWPCPQPSLIIENLLRKRLAMRGSSLLDGQPAQPLNGKALCGLRTLRGFGVWNMGPTQGLEGNLIRHVWCYFNAGIPW